MNKTKKIILILLCISGSVIALDFFEDIGNAIRSGDSRQIATFFGNTIELTIVNQENVYSKAQAELIIRDFFVKNPPKAFTILHKGSSPEGTQYAIGNLTTTNQKTFRTSFYVKNNNGKYLLQELRFESE